MPTMKINYLAVGVAALAVLVLGALWYSPLLFGDVWVRAHGYTPEQVAEMQKSGLKTFGLAGVCYLVMGAVLSVLMGKAGVASVGAGVRLSVLCWVGFAATLGLTAHLFSDTPLTVYFIDTAYQLAYLVVMGAILSAWRR